MAFEHISFRLTHPKDFELFSSFNTEGKLALKGYELLPLHPKVLTDNAVQDKVWVQEKIAINGTDLQEIICEAQRKGEIVSPLQYSTFVEQMRIEYDGQLTPMSYEKYVEDMKIIEYSVRLEFNKTGTQQLAAVTNANVGCKLAVVADGFVLIAPFIREPVLGGSVHLSTSGNEAEVRKLVKLMTGDGSINQGGRNKVIYVNWPKGLANLDG